MAALEFHELDSPHLTVVDLFCMGSTSDSFFFVNSNLNALQRSRRDEGTPNLLNLK